uniref:Uncharacterized protein n=1 Tax=Anguilla anguilla TaxID=7936 RepID=A0A0E9U6Y7_ANGAN
MTTERGACQGSLRRAGDACSLSTARRGKLPAPAQADRVSRPKPSSRRLLELCKEDLQEEQVDVAEGLGLKA